ncbi:hypothetical protein N0V88_005319 [Collariella sp. IMI 366227]|nr:hypothetical protein N0V88_005319 [Collariella sp. IMI 366227]
MSSTGGDWPSAGDSDSMADGNQFDRPVQLSEMGVFHSGRLVSVTPQQAQRNLKLLSVPWESLPQIPFFGPLFLYTTEGQKAHAGTRLATVSTGLGRVVTPTEADAIAYYNAKFYAQSAWSMPASLAVTTYYYRRGRETWRFPWYTPRGAFTPLAFPSLKWQLATGIYSMNIWRVLRFGAYLGCCNFVVKNSVLALAQMSCLVGMARDERLQEMSNLIGRKREERRERFQEKRGLPPQPPVSQPPSPQDPAGAQPYPTENFQDSPEQPRLQQQQQQQQQSPQQPTRWTQPAPQTQTPPQDDDSFLFDDASPVAPAQQQTQQQPQRGTTGPGSAWDRLRQTSKAEEGRQWRPQGGAAPQQDGQGQQTSDYTFSSTEQDKAYAKEQAQKEFDAMLERERRGTGESGSR